MTTMTSEVTYEPWTKEIDGMVSTLEIIVQHDQTVRVIDSYIEEFGFDRSRGTEVVDVFGQRFVIAFPLWYIRDRLREQGWSRAPP